jgi:Domain of unknown function (DUF5102)
MFLTPSTALTAEAERQVPGVGQVLVTEEQRATLAVLLEDGGRSKRGVNWRRSRARREMLVRLGIPIDLDEVKPPCSRFLSGSYSYYAYCSLCLVTVL